MYDKSRRKRKDNHQPLMFYIGQLVATIVPVLKLHRKLVLMITRALGHRPG